MSKITKILIFLPILTLWCFLSPSIAEMDHTLLIESYEGSKTCKECHYAETVDLTESLHYKLMGEVQGVSDMFTNQPVEGQHGKGDRY